jgi:hypothetical protein
MSRPRFERLQQIPMPNLTTSSLWHANNLMASWLDISFLSPSTHNTKNIPTVPTKKRNLIQFLYQIYTPITKKIIFIFLLFLHHHLTHFQRKAGSTPHVKWLFIRISHQFLMAFNGLNVVFAGFQLVRNWWQMLNLVVPKQNTTAGSHTNSPTQQAQPN